MDSNFQTGSGRWSEVLKKLTRTQDSVEKDLREKLKNLESNSAEYIKVKSQIYLMEKLRGSIWRANAVMAKSIHLVKKHHMKAERIRKQHSKLKKIMNRKYPDATDNNSEESEIVPML